MMKYLALLLLLVPVLVACGSPPDLIDPRYCAQTTIDPRGTRNDIVVYSTEPPAISQLQPRATMFQFVGPLEVHGEKNASYAARKRLSLAGSLTLVLTDGTSASVDDCP